MTEILLKVALCKQSTMYIHTATNINYCFTRISSSLTIIYTSRIIDKYFATGILTNFKKSLRALDKTTTIVIKELRLWGYLGWTFDSCHDKIIKELFNITSK